MAEKDLYFDVPFLDETEELPRGLNTPNSLLPLFLKQILSIYHASEQHPMSQQKIIRILEEYPYELAVDRRTVGRALKTLEVYGHSGIHTGTEGSWYDVRDDWFNMNRYCKSDIAA